MGKNPSFQLYYDDLLGGTILFSDEQFGKYVKLLILQFKKVRLTEEIMLQVCKVKKNGEWVIDPVIGEKFVRDEEGFYYNEKMDEVRITRGNFVKSRKKNVSGDGKVKVSTEQYPITYVKSSDEVMGESDGVKSGFRKYWEMYPKKIGIRQAEQYYNETVLNADDEKDLEKALKNYKEECRKNRTEDKYIKNGSTFFSTWQEYVNIGKPEDSAPVYSYWEKQLIQKLDRITTEEEWTEYSKEVKADPEYTALDSEDKARIKGRFDTCWKYRIQIYKQFIG
ncbi:MAG: hypothetical protein WCL06_00020 [Bacteroidota bacterium]